MKFAGNRARVLSLPALVLALAVPTLAAAQQLPPDTNFSSNVSGRAASFTGENASGLIDFNSPFFQPIGQQYGGNTRTCASCHRADQAWSVSPVKIQTLFEFTAGLDPLFDPVDGTNAPNSDVSTLEARRRASSLLLAKGLIRVGQPLATTAEFDIIAVATPSDGSFPADFTANVLNTRVLSMYRRPPSIANSSFLTEVMWDARETVPGRSLNDSLIMQAMGATRGHMEADGNLPQTLAELTPAQQQEFLDIVRFETNIFAAQHHDVGDLASGFLDAAGGLGGPVPLFAPPPALSQGGIFNLYSAWSDLVANPSDPGFIEVQTRRSVARGENLFNTRTFNTGPNIAGTATCATCHSNRALGNSVTRQKFNMGLSTPGLVSRGIRTNAVFPVYSLRRKLNGQVVTTTDPGRALITGRWIDGDKFKVPILRGLSGRAPYFHGGQAADLGAVVDFYNGRFAIGLTVQERLDVINFLRAL